METINTTVSLFVLRAYFELQITQCIIQGTNTSKKGVQLIVLCGFNFRLCPETVSFVPFCILQVMCSNSPLSSPSEQ